MGITDIVITVVGLAVLIGIIIFLCKALVRHLRGLRNSIRAMSGKDPAELVKAQELLKTHSKNNLLPSWYIDEALAILRKIYDPLESAQILANHVEIVGYRCLEFPEKMALPAGTSRDKLEEHCRTYFDKFNFKKMQKNNSMTDKDFKTMEHLGFCWYFADDSLSTVQEAHDAVRKALGAYCEKTGKGA